MHAAIKHALAQFSITPALDFDLDSSIQQLPSIQQPFNDERQAAATSTSIFRGFTEKNQAHFIDSDKKAEIGNWKGFLESRQSAVNNMQAEAGISQPETSNQQPAQLITHYSSLITVTQLHNQFLLAQTENGFILISQQAAHERVLYEKLTEAINGSPIATQRSIFPITFELAAADSALLEELMSDLQQLGFIVEPFGKDTFIIQGTPADLNKETKNGD